jgi:hypothetical protein
MDENKVFLDGRGVEADKTKFPNNKRQCQDWKRKDRPKLLKREVTIKYLYQKVHDIYTSITFRKYSYMF